jgi:hypothetical protein
MVVLVLVLATLKAVAAKFFHAFFFFLVMGKLEPALNIVFVLVLVLVLVLVQI